MVLYGFTQKKSPKTQQTEWWIVLPKAVWYCGGKACNSEQPKELNYTTCMKKEKHAELMTIFQVFGKVSGGLRKPRENKHRLGEPPNCCGSSSHRGRAKAGRKRAQKPQSLEPWIQQHYEEMEWLRLSVGKDSFWVGLTQRCVLLPSPNAGYQLVIPQKKRKDSILELLENTCVLTSPGEELVRLMQMDQSTENHTRIIQHKSDLEWQGLKQAICMCNSD